jgi:hypothetical protein
VYTARLICSDPACPEGRTAETATLQELNTLACECGCALEVVGWPDVAAEPLARVIVLKVAQARAQARAA